MKIQVFSQYLKLAEKGKVAGLFCPSAVHTEDIAYFNAYFLLTPAEENNKIMLQCLACGYKQTVGIQLYENILRKIKEVENDRT